MQVEKLARLDLNLLVCFKVLYEECSVTRTAHRLCLSQSSISKSLAKLRIQFNDPLFIRKHQGLTPTLKASTLAPKITELLLQFEMLNEPEHFDPVSSDYRFQIATIESAYPLILPHFLPEMFKQAPQVTISTHTWSDTTFEQLKHGDLDFGLTGKDLDINDAKLTLYPPSDICEQEIFRDVQICALRADHPLLKQEWNFDTYIQARHIQVRCDGNERWLLDYRLADQGLERDIAITVPDFNSAISLCTYTDFIFTAPQHFVSMAAKQHGLVTLPLPMKFPAMAYTLFWHQQRENDRALHWLKDLIIASTQHLRPHHLT